MNLDFSNRLKRFTVKFNLSKLFADTNQLESRTSGKPQLKGILEYLPT